MAGLCLCVLGATPLSTLQMRLGSDMAGTLGNANVGRSQSN